jgi:hypothetical protein
MQRGLLFLTSEVTPFTTSPITTSPIYTQISLLQSYPSHNPPCQYAKGAPTSYLQSYPIYYPPYPYLSFSPPKLPHSPPPLSTSELLSTEVTHSPPPLSTRELLSTEVTPFTTSPIHTCDSQLRNYPICASYHYGRPLCDSWGSSQCILTKHYQCLQEARPSTASRVSILILSFSQR